MKEVKKGSRAFTRRSVSSRGKSGTKFLRQENARHVGGYVSNLGWESRSQGFRDGSQSMESWYKDLAFTPGE